MTSFPDLTKPLPHSFEGRSGARLAAVQALFQIEQSQANATTVLMEFLQHRLHPDHQTIDLDHEETSVSIDSNFFSALVRGTIQQQSLLDEMISSCLAEGWTLNRIESVIRAILRAAAFELKEMKSTPAAVIINEYLDLTKAFFSDKESSFVNGVLDKIAKQLRQDTDPRHPVSPTL